MTANQWWLLNSHFNNNHKLAQDLLLRTPRKRGPPFETDDYAMKAQSTIVYKLNKEKHFCQFERACGVNLQRACSVRRNTQTLNLLSIEQVKQVTEMPII